MNNVCCFESTLINDSLFNCFAGAAYVGSLVRPVAEVNSRSS